MIGLSLSLLSFSLVFLLTFIKENKKIQIPIYFIFSSITGISLGFYGSTTYIILINKCDGIFEIIGFAFLFYLVSDFFQLLSIDTLKYFGITNVIL